MFLLEQSSTHNIFLIFPITSTTCVSAHLTVVEPESHVLLLDAEPLRQVEVDVLDSAHTAEASRVGEHPLQGSIWRRHTSR